MHSNQPCIAAILAHSDDLELYCGGTFAKYIARGYRGVYGVLSTWTTGHTKVNGASRYLPTRAIRPRSLAEMQRAAQVFGAELFALNLADRHYTDADGRAVPLTYALQTRAGEGLPPEVTPLVTASTPPASADASAGAIMKVAELLIKYRPRIVIAQTVDGGNIDHFAAALIVHKAYRQAAASVTLGPLYMRLTEASFFRRQPDWVVDVTGYEEVAEKAIACYESQGGTAYHVRMRARWREAGAKIGVKSAEPFARLLDCDHA